MGYQTYVWGTNAIYDKGLVDALASNGVEMFFHMYQSNWRVLHIDDFEWDPFPRHTGRQLQFFQGSTGVIEPTWKRKFGETTKDASIEWTNTAGDRT